MASSNTQNKICIMGLGWLGQALADHYREKQWRVFGSTRTPEKLAKLKHMQISTCLFDLYQTSPASIDDAFFSDAVLVLNIPPGRKHLDAKRFTLRLKQLIDHAFLHGLKKLVFISTTSVFNGCSGVVEHNTAKQPNTGSGKAHAYIEDYLMQHYPEHSSVLRLSGLIGGNRHPILSLSGKKGISLGKDPVNLVHRDDVLASIQALIAQDKWGLCLNICALEHPSREKYYTWCAQQMGLVAPEFEADTRKQASGKQIDASHSFSVLGLKPRYPSPFDMLS